MYQERACSVCEQRHGTSTSAKGVNDPMPASPSSRPDITYRRAFRWRLLTFAGGGLLAATFFMPAVDGCNSPVVPAEAAWRIGSDLPQAIRDAELFSALEGLTFLFYVYSAAYLFGLLVVLVTLSRLTTRRRLQSIPRACLILFTLILAGGMCALTTYLLWDAGWLALENLFIPGDLLGHWVPVIDLTLMPLWLLALLVIVWRRRNPPELSITFVTGLFAMHWFSYWSISSRLSSADHYGIHLSFVSSCVIVVAVLGEARAVSRQSWLRTLGQLMTGRFRGEDQRVGMCPKCGYNLYGLTERRCPECGRGFTFEEVGATAEALSFGAGPAASALPEGTAHPPPWPLAHERNSMTRP